MVSKLVLPVIVVTTGFWYLTSSMNAVASQQLFRGLLKELTALFTDDDDAKAIEKWGVVVLSVVLTLGQLCAGSLMSLSALYCLGGKTRQTQLESPAVEGTTAIPKNQVQELFQQLQRQDIIIGLLHCFGSVCTNIGYGYGSASLVQVIKLIEPIQTLLLTALVQKSMQVLSFQKVTSTITIISGTYMLLSNKSIEVIPKSVFFAIGSGMCLATRNVFSKQRQASKQSTTSKEGEAKTFREIMLKGMKKFAGITVMAAASNIALALVMVPRSSRLLETMLPRLVRYSPKILCEVIIFHCLYNMSSITVLSLTSAPSHSLLNVGKRIFNVIVAAVAFGTPIAYKGRVGLLVAAIGGCFYTLKDPPPFMLNFRNTRRFLIIASVCACIFLQFRSTRGFWQFYEPISRHLRKNAQN